MRNAAVQKSGFEECGVVRVKLSYYRVVVEVLSRVEATVEQR
jgi:hypothetical protein